MFSVSSLPILSTVPRSGTWFLRYAISFLCHLDRGGRIDDRLTGRTVGDPSGPSFDFQSFRGGPLFNVHGTLPDNHLFIGHTVCPGFAASDVDWWETTPFHVPGYDYFHEGMNYRYTPIDLAAYRYTPVRVRALERAARRGRGRPIALVYRNPLDQAVSYFRYGQNHKEATYNAINGRPLSAVSLRDYLLESALPSYAKQFVSFQALAERHPLQVRLVPYERLMADPVTVLAVVLDHLAGTALQREWLADAVWLARPEHMKAIEKELGRSLDGTRINRGSHISQVIPGRTDVRLDDGTRAEAMAFLNRLGLDIGLFEWPLAKQKQAATAA
jgi:Sulfotransferase domain